MVVFALARLIGGLYRDSAGVLTLSITWTHTWLHLESSVAVLMGGITAFRTVFAGHVRAAGQRQGSSTSLYKRIRGVFQNIPTQSNSGHSENEKKGRGFLAGPQTGGTMKGMRTIIRKLGREPGSTILDGSLASENHDPLESYHRYVKRVAEPTGTSSNGSNLFLSKASTEMDVSFVCAMLSRYVLTCK